jgi:hypothetical protein
MRFALYDPNADSYPLRWVADDEKEALALLIGPESIDKLHLAMLERAIEYAVEDGSCVLGDDSILMTSYMERKL